MTVKDSGNQECDGTADKQLDFETTENTNTAGQVFKILQWNAHSLNLFKAEELAEYAKRKSIDIICTSELGPRRKIRAYQQYVVSDTFTQSGVFWKNSLRVKNVSIKCLERKHNNILTQCGMIEGELLLVHVYILIQHSSRQKGPHIGYHY